MVTDTGTHSIIECITMSTIRNINSDAELIFHLTIGSIDYDDLVGARHTC